jgi:hypothetical protein
MAKGATLENPVVQFEWYLAKKEADDGELQHCSGLLPSPDQ